MAERKDTNPFSSEDSNPHLPPNVYHPNPFPINPTEGNPWAASNTYQQPTYQGHANNNSSSAYSYGHGYNTSTDGGGHPTYIPMPSPSTYKSDNSSFDYTNNAYNTPTYNANAYNTNIGSEVNAYEDSSNVSQVDNNKEEYDNNTTELDSSASAANPGIETHDPDKLKISSQMLETPKSAPNKWRLLSRFIQFLASAGAFAFIVAANPVSNILIEK
jgi:hypothetical protein